MTVADDLATLRRGLMLDPQPRDAIPSVTEVEVALARVEAEIARLGNALAQERAKPEGSFDQWARLQAAEAEIARLEYLHESCERLLQDKANELLDAVAEKVAAEAEIARLTTLSERQGRNIQALYRQKRAAEDEVARLKQENREYHDQAVRDYQRINQAKGREARLRDGLRRIDRLAGEHDGVNEDAFEAITDITRPFLLAEDGAEFPVVNDEQLEAMGLPTDDEIGGAA